MNNTCIPADIFGLKQAKMGEITVVEEPTEKGKYGCYDGGFRLQAYRALRYKEIPIIVGSGTPLELMLKSFDSGDKLILLNPLRMPHPSLFPFTRSSSITKQDLIAWVRRCPSESLSWDKS